MFKWVEDAVFEELEDALAKLVRSGNEISELRSESNELIAVLGELKEEAKLSNMEFLKLKLCVKMCIVWLVVITIVIVCFMVMGKGHEKKLMFDY